MNSNINFKEIVVLAVVFTVVDSVYLNSVASFFNNVVKNVQGKPLTLNMYATILCYISLIFGLYYFIVREKKSFIDAGILGFFVYSVFETTNKAIFNNWSWTAVIIDSLWGGLLFGISTYLVYKIYGIK